MSDARGKTRMQPKCEEICIDTNSGLAKIKESAYRQNEKNTAF